MSEKTYVLRLTEEEFDLLSDAILLARRKSHDMIWYAKDRPDSEFAVSEGKEAEEILPKLKLLHKTVWSAQIVFEQEGVSDDVITESNKDQPCKAGQGKGL